MEKSKRNGLMAVFAVSGSIVLLAYQLHKRLLSNFMDRIHYQTERSEKKEGKKRVRFAKDVMEPSCNNNKQYRERRSTPRLYPQPV